MDKINSIGERLVEAFGTNDKEFIAKKLGFSTVQGLYKVIRGERELDFEKLLNFKKWTNRTVDWLLTGENEVSEQPVREPSFEETFERRVKEIVRTEIKNLRSEIAEPDEENVEIEPAEMILAPVIAHIGPGIKREDPKEEVRKSLLSDESLKEMEKRLKPRKRKTG